MFFCFPGAFFMVLKGFLRFFACFSGDFILTLGLTQGPTQGVIFLFFSRPLKQIQVRL